MASTSNPELPPPPTLLCSLAPQANSFRTVNECSGFWDFAADPTDVGVRDGWPSRGPPEPKHIAVGSWNEQLPELRDYLGVSWYAKRVARPRALATDRAFLRVGAASYHCSVYVDGVLLGVHEGGHVPFEVALPHASTPAEAVQASQAATEAPPTHVASASQAEPWLVVLRIEAFLSTTRLPPGGLACKPQQFPNASYDFFPLAGLHRPVSVVVLPQFSIEDITVVTSRLTAGGGAELSVRVCASSVTDGSIDVSLYSGDRVGGGAAALASAAAALLATPDGGSRGVFGATLSVPALVALWSPSSPRLHTLRVSLRAGAARLDQYDLVIGIRTVEVAGDAVLLNGAPFSFRGFGRHEDAALSGRGLNLCASVRDAASMRWVGANSYRGAHYPHSEESLDIADREGFAVIGETPAVYLCFHDGNDAIAARLDAAKRATAELVARDKNRACVVLWSLANEPESNEHMGTHGVAVPPPSDASWKAKGQEFFAELFALARALDPSRPLTLAAHPASDVSWIDLCDVVCTNRYNGWYGQPGDLAAGVAKLGAALDHEHAMHRRPFILTEFGADALPGMHAEPPEMGSEEYQRDMIAAYLDLRIGRPWLVGFHIWCLNDFKTSQSVRRMGGLNYKGVFTRDRRPKLAAHYLRARWAAEILARASDEKVHE